MIIQSISIFAAAFIIALSGAMMPGPLLTVTVTKVAQRGFWQGPLIVLGHALLELVLVIALIFGLKTILDAPITFSIIGIAGGLALIVMGGDIIRKISLGILHFTLAGDKKAGSASAALTGIVTSLSNPYWTLWWMTIGAGYIVVAVKAGTVGIISFYLGHISGDFAWYSLIAIMVARGRAYLSDKLFQIFLSFCGIILIGLGCYFIYAGLLGK